MAVKLDYALIKLTSGYLHDSKIKNKQEKQSYAALENTSNLKGEALNSLVNVLEYIVIYSMGELHLQKIMLILLALELLGDKQDL